MTNSNQGPFLRSYWVWPGHLLAGPFPGAWDEDKARQKLQALINTGITLVIDLTEPGEHDSYVAMLHAEAAAVGYKVKHYRLAIPDMDIPSPDLMTTILDTIDSALDEGEVVYVHCMGGIGRTGTTIGCYLVRHGMTGDEALNEIVRLRGGLEDSPETFEQHMMVRHWRE
ncbi:MAG: dual specificity protein phosphatase family protein [Chloroflexi bacterium]|nr:dual specificity protein phosphatase family protein [Chloroflexota bacterium]